MAGPDDGHDQPGTPRGDPAGVHRRALLSALGLLGTAATLPGLMPGPASAAPAGARPADSVPLARTSLDALTRDTMSGLAVFVMPGPDRYSARQGTPRREPGGIEARLPDFLIRMLDRYLPFPDAIGVPLVGALLDGAPKLTRGLPPPRTSGVGASPATAGLLDEGLRRLLESDATIPLSPVVALLLNLEAVRADPRSLSGPFLSPFARLSFAGKAEVFELLEGPDPTLVEVLDRGLPEPLKRSASGLLRFLAGALLELSALGGYSEWAVFDPATRKVRSRPVGWQVSGYTPSIDGWPEYRGYYQGRRKVTG